MGRRVGRDDRECGEGMLGEATSPGDRSNGEGVGSPVGSGVGRESYHLSGERSGEGVWGGVWRK